MTYGSQNTRRLSAILAADVADYSRLMHEDEAGTIAAWSAARTGVIEPKLSEFSGRLVKQTGDGFLAEFATGSDAVACAVAMQNAFAAQPLNFRMGINLGEVVDDGGDIHGDGVNIAARLEGLARPGGISISGDVYNQVHNKLPLRFVDKGRQSVKNIARPIRVYDIELAGSAAPVSEPWRGGMVIAAAAILLAVVIVGVGSRSGGLFTTWFSAQPPAQPPLTAGRPAIAVLPFTNIGNDKDQDYFVDGMTDDLITDISKISGIRVIARNSTFSYKGRTWDVREVATALGVSHVIEGSVRKAGQTLRINVQLIDGKNGSPVWADRFDRQLKDVFAIQDEVIQHIISALSLKLSAGEKSRVTRRGTQNIEAYELLMRGREQESFFTQRTNKAAVAFFEQAIALDPNYAEAYAHLSIVKGLIATFDSINDISGALTESLKLAEKAVALDPALPLAHFALGRILSRQQVAEYTRAIAAFRKAVELDPNHADSYANLGFVSIFTGDANAAKRWVDFAITINPHHPFWYLFARAMALYFLGDYHGAVADLKVATERNPTAIFNRYWLAAALAQAGRIEDAKWEVDELRGMGRLESRREFLENNPITYPPYKAKLAEGLEKAGLK